MIERIHIDTHLPESFYALGQTPYQELPYQPEENADYLHQLLGLHSEAYRVILYTDHQSVRLLGLFPIEVGQVKFAFWESTNEQASGEAFAMLEADTLAQGFSHITGPLAFNTLHRYRLRQDDAPWGQFDREPVNPPQYATWLHLLGYEPTMGYMSRYVRAADVPTWYDAKEELVEVYPKLPFRFVVPTPENWTTREEDIYELVNATFSNNPGYRAISLEEFRLLYNPEYAAKLCPHSSVFFEDKASGKLIALNLSMPNYAPLGQAREGTFALDYPKLKAPTLLIKSIGVHPEYRGQNVMNLLGSYTLQNFRKYYHDAIFCLMRSDNLSLNFTRGLPYQEARYALYEKHL